MSREHFLQHIDRQKKHFVLFLTCLQVAHYLSNQLWTYENMIFLVFCISGIGCFHSETYFFITNCFCSADSLEDDEKPEKVG